MYLPIAAAKKPQINAAVADVMKELAPLGVERINYEIAQDWSGEWAIFFRVLLSDAASSRDNLLNATTQVIWRMSAKLDLPNLGLFPHFDFRSQSEQAKVKEPAWA